MKGKTKKKIFISFACIISVMIVIVGAVGIYLGDYYKAQIDSQTVFAPQQNIVKTVLDDGTVVYMPEKPCGGLIFYPGGKVEYTAYIPLMEACAAEGVACVLVEMPFNLAVFDVNAADGIIEMYPEVEKWYIGGHSLGGSMAAMHLSENGDDFEGLVLLGSYSTADISDMSVNVLSVYGDEDKVMNREKYNEYKVNLPHDFTEVIIDGGCHAYFGMYGEQEGDGVARITNREQIAETAHLIGEQIRQNKKRP